MKPRGLAGIGCHGNAAASAMAAVSTLLLLAVGHVTGVVDQPSNPRIVEHPEDQYVNRNDPATLNCKAEGDPPPVVTWYRRGQLVITANENPTSHRMLLPSGQLFFLRVQHSPKNLTDTGVYYCNATNPITHVSAISNNATLELAVLRDDFREQPPHSVDVALGAEVSLPCRPPRGKPDPKVRWKKDSDVVKISDRISVDEAGTLRIRDSVRNDSGVYICVAANIAGERDSTPCRVSVKDKPRIVEGPKDLTVQEGTDALFRCQSDMDPDVTVIWKKQDGQIPPGRSRILDDRSLKIERVDITDDGVYVCRVENTVGFQESEARLAVHTQPSFVVTPQDKVAGVGRRVSFRCQVTGNPVPAVFWSKEASQQLMFANFDNGRLSVMDDGTLVIESVQKEDAGEYVCKGLSIAGSAYAKARLDVRDVDPRPPPIIHQGPQNQTLPVNSLALLPCLATGDPAPSIRWFKNYRELQMRDPRFALLDSGTLQIADLRKSDTGVYTCRAVSETGETARGAALVVETPTNPSVIFHRTPEPSTFPGSPSKPAVSEVTDSSVRLSWRPSATHGASPVYAYTVEYFSHDTGEGWIVASDGVEETTFTVRNLRPDTSYLFLVRAQNSHGLSLPSPVTTPVRTKVGTSPPSGRPGSPGSSNSDAMLFIDKLRSTQLVHIAQIPDPLNSTAIRVNWELKRIQPRYIDGFHVRYRMLPDVDQSSAPSSSGGMEMAFREDVVHGGTSTSHVVVGLARHTLYEVQVQPFIQDVVGQESNMVRVRTAEDVPTAPPKNIHFVMIGNTTVRLSWEPPDKQHRNGLLRGYKIFIYNNESGFFKPLFANASETSIIIHNVQKDVHYKAQLLAHNRIGDGVLSEPIVIGPPTSAAQLGVVQQPWFIGTVIGTVGGALWFALCVFSLWLCRRRRRRRKHTHTNGVVSVPVRKSEDPARLGYPVTAKDIQRRPLPPHEVFQQQPDLTRLTISGGGGMMGGGGKPDMYDSGLPSEMKNSNNGPMKGSSIAFTPPSESVFRPINQAYIIQSAQNPPVNPSYLGSRDRVGSSEPPAVYNRNASLTSAPKQPQLFLPPPPQHPPPGGMPQGHLSTSDHCDDDEIYSRIPASSSDGGDNYGGNNYPGDNYGRNGYGGQNYGGDDYGHDNNYGRDDYGQPPNYYSSAVVGGMPYGTDNRPLLRETSPNMNPIPPQRSLQNSGGAAPMSKFSTASPQLQRRLYDQLRAYSPRAASEPEPCSPTPPHYKMAVGGGGGGNPADRRVPYSDGEGSLAHGGRNVSPPSPAPPGMADMMMDRAMQSSLPSLADEQLQALGAHRMHDDELCGDESPSSEVTGLPDFSGFSELGGYSVGHPDLEDMSDVGQRDCHSPVSSIDEMERAVADSVLASWADAIDGTNEDGTDANTAVNDSDVSSEKSTDSSDPDASFFAEADFAVAVARAAELSGLTVVGSTIVDPNSQRDKVKRPKRRQRAPRPASPYSTDSNYSAVLAAVPHRPYPKSERKRQIAPNRQGRHHHSRHGGGNTGSGSGGGGGGYGPQSQSPGIRPQQQQQQQQQQQAMNNNINNMSDTNPQMPLLGRYPGGSGTGPGPAAGSDFERERLLRKNPLDAFDMRDTPIV